MSGDRLAAALAAFRDADTAETQQRVLDELAGAELIFPAAERGPQDRGVRLAFTKDERGRPVLPGFTDQQHLSTWLPGGGPYAKAPASGYLPTVLNGPFAGLALNPGSDAGAFVDRRALEVLAAGKTAQVLSDSGEVGLVQRWAPAPS
jgi:hypothetical protein